MKKFFLLLGILLSFLIRVSAQQIDNSDFEIWNDQTHPRTWNCSINIGFDIPTGERTTDAYQGSYAILLQTQAYFSYTIPGMVQLGELIIQSDTAYMQGGYPLNAHPSGLSFYAKYLPKHQDTAFVIAYLTRYNTDAHKRDTIAATGYIITDTVATYTEFLLPFLYKNQNDTADTINIIFLSSNPRDPKVGTKLYIDNVQLLYGFVAYPTIALSAQNITDTSFIARWLPSIYSSHYELDVATDKNFIHILPEYNSLPVDDTNMQYVSIPSYKPDELYYRVRVKYGDTAISPNSNTIEVIPPYPILCLPATDIVEGEHFTALWRNRKHAQTYFLDVASDSSFTHFLSGYENLNVGKDTSYTVNNLGLDTFYYYRVRALYSTGLSDNSNVIKVRLIAKILSQTKMPKIITQNNTLIIKELDPLTQINIYDLNGKKIYNKKAQSTQIEFYIPQQGVYLIEFNKGKKRYTVKIKI